MTAASVILQSYRRELGQYGELIHVRRYSGTGPGRTHVDTPMRARVRGYQAAELVNTIQQGDRHIVGLAEDVAGILPITPSDKVIVRGRELAVMSVDDSSRRVGSTLIAVELQARG